MGYTFEAADKLRFAYYGSVNGVLVPHVGIGSTKSGNNPGTMAGATSTAALVDALRTTLTFRASDNIRVLDVYFAVLNPSLQAVLAALLRVNGADLYDDDDALAAGTCESAYPNAHKRILCAAPITTVSIVGMPSGIASAVYTGNRLFITGRA